ncbi:MAG: single-stranded DNA-binding protein [Syntrophomonadaceae bacterium]|nr:single-stranded DNA-binding protein [Syntrophomonadaceae bacterium]
MYNRVILIGRLTQDPELRYTQNGTAVASFTVAVNRKFKRDEADFIPVVVWNKAAENCANYLGKGRLVAVEGRLQIRSYEAQDGQRRRVTEVVADEVKFLDRAGTSSASSTPTSSARDTDDWGKFGREVNLSDIDIVDHQDEDEIPF